MNQNVLVSSKFQYILFNYYLGSRSINNFYIILLLHLALDFVQK